MDRLFKMFFIEVHKLIFLILLDDQFMIENLEKLIFIHITQITINIYKYVIKLY